MLLLPPALSQLLDAAHRLAAGEPASLAVQEALPPARGFVIGGGRLLEQLSPAILRTPRVLELLETARREVETQRRALDFLERAALAGSAAGAARAAEELRAGTARLQEALRALEAEEREAPTYSPHPELDAFLKVGRNVLDLRVPPPALASAWRPAAARAARLRTALDRFRLLHRAPGAESGVAALERLEAGLGAAAEFLRAGLRVPLEDALRLVAPASVELHELLRTLEEAISERGPARDLLVADLLRADDPELAERLRAELRLVLEEEEVRVEALRHHPLRALAGLDAEPAARALERAVRSQEDLPALDGLLDELRRELAAQEELLARALQPVAGAPLLEDLQVLVGRSLLGELAPRHLREELDHFRALQGELAAELQRSAGQMDPREEDELQRLLMRQAAGAERLAAGLAEGEPRYLREGWEMLAESAPGLREISEALRARLQPESPAPGPTCVRCGAANPREARYCQRCSAVLPALYQAPTEYSDITGGEEAAPVPSHVLRLEHLVRRVEEGGAGPEDVQAEVDELLERATRVAQGFEQQVAPRAGSDPTVREYAGFFQEQMELYFDGLHTMRHFAEDAHPEYLYRGLEACRQAGAELMAMRRRIETALPGL